MSHTHDYLYAVFYSLFDHPGMVIESLQFTYTPTVRERSIVAALYVARHTELDSQGARQYQAGALLFEKHHDQIHFLQRIPIKCRTNLETVQPKLHGIFTHDARWLLLDVRAVNDLGPNILGYYNPMISCTPLGTSWHIAVPKTDPYHYTPFGGTVRVDRTGKLIQIN